MPDATFAEPDLTTFAGLDELGLEVMGQRLEPGRAVLACRVVEPDQWCRRCGCEGAVRDTVTRRLAHEPFGWRPTTLAGDALDRCRCRCRRRVQHDTRGHRGLAGDPLYRARRTLHTGADLLTDKQKQRIHALFEAEDHVQVEVTWGVYQG